MGLTEAQTSFSLTSDSPMPIAGNVGIKLRIHKVSDNWRACQSGDSYYNATAGSGSSQNNIDEINVSRTGLSYNSDVESLRITIQVMEKQSLIITQQAIQL